ncbi:nuclear transport factor 2 family protein [Marinilabiliaceae bacterium JC017]|nr:nuclear transport factor 2 family protein [Marinilabiliaceae bacterium JC017]
MKNLLLFVVLAIAWGCCPKTNEQKDCEASGHSTSVINPVSTSDLNTIKQLMGASKDCWNKGDFEGYMDVYWRSDSLKFMGLNSITYGWNSTLAMYKRAYPNETARGRLTYTFDHFEQLATDCLLVVGKFHLQRQENLEGYFSLIWKKIDGEWKIILDHT